jgi:UDP-GlcNAc3NAcA epimerase
MHPRTQKELKQNQFFNDGKIEIITPLSYFSMLGHLSQCSFVITDSGGLQKEAYFSGKRCLIARDETEWVELLEHGASRLVGPFSAGAKDVFEWASKPLGKLDNIYGEGNSGELIVEKLAMLIAK